MTRYEHYLTKLKDYEENFINGDQSTTAYDQIRLYRHYLNVLNNNTEGVRREMLLYQVAMKFKCDTSTVRRIIKRMEAPWQPLVKPSWD